VTASNETNVSASGTADPGDSISVKITDGTHTTTAVTTTATGGTWSVSGIDATSLTDGTITLEVTATNSVQNSLQVNQPLTKGP
jgi:hypothetical protein